MRTQYGSLRNGAQGVDVKGIAAGKADGIKKIRYYLFDIDSEDGVVAPFFSSLAKN